MEEIKVNKERIEKSKKKLIRLKLNQYKSNKVIKIN